MPFFATTEREKLFLLGIVLMVGGAGFLLFNGESETSSSDSFEVFGGRDENRPMSRGASIFWGLVFIAGGIALLCWNS